MDKRANNHQQIMSEVEDDLERKMAAYQKLKENFKFLDFLEEREYSGGDEMSERSIGDISGRNP